MMPIVLPNNKLRETGRFANTHRMGTENGQKGCGVGRIAAPLLNQTSPRLRLPSRLADSKLRSVGLPERQCLARAAHDQMKQKCRSRLATGFKRFAKERP